MRTPTLSLSVCKVLCRSKSELCVFGAASAAHFYFEEKNMEKYSLCGEKIAYCREKLQFSKKELAEHMGVSVSTLSKYEKGIFMPSVMPLYILSLIMDMPMETFVSDDFSLEEFKKMSAKITSEMFIELHNDIVKGIF